MKTKNKSNKIINDINEESKASIIEFHQKQILTNIKYHKVFLFFLFLTNTFLVIFIFFYKRKINEIKMRSGNHTSKIDTENNEIETLRSSLNHKLLNINALSKNGEMRFSFIFENSEEFNTLKNLVYEYKSKLMGIKGNPIKTVLLYQSIIDDYTTFLNRISYLEDIIILIQTDNGNKFGIYVQDTIRPNKVNEFESKSKNIFYIHLKLKKCMSILEIIKHHFLSKKIS